MTMEGWKDMRGKWKSTGLSSNLHYKWVWIQDKAVSLNIHGGAD